MQIERRAKRERGETDMAALIYYITVIVTFRNITVFIPLILSKGHRYPSPRQQRVKGSEPLLLCSLPIILGNRRLREVRRNFISSVNFLSENVLYMNTVETVSIDFTFTLCF